MLTDSEAKQYDKWGVDPPSSTDHGTDDEIRQNLMPMRAIRWRQEGNTLIGESDRGEFAQRIPTDYILQGTDPKGLPILKRLS